MVRSQSQLCVFTFFGVGFASLLFFLDWTVCGEMWRWTSSWKTSTPPPKPNIDLRRSRELKPERGRRRSSSGRRGWANYSHSDYRRNWFKLDSFSSLIIRTDSPHWFCSDWTTWCTHLTGCCIYGHHVVWCDVMSLRQTAALVAKHVAYLVAATISLHADEPMSFLLCQRTAVFDCFCLLDDNTAPHHRMAPSCGTLGVDGFQSIQQKSHFMCFGWLQKSHQVWIWMG